MITKYFKANAFAAAQASFMACAMSICMLLISNNANATTTFDLDVEVLLGDFTGTTGTGSFSFDESLIGGSGSESLGPDQFTLELTVFGQVFTEDDDVDFPDYAQLLFEDGLPIAIDFIVEGIIIAPGVENFGMLDIMPTKEGYYGELIVNDGIGEVPIPPSVWLMSGGIIGIIGIARRKV